MESSERKKHTRKHTHTDVARIIRSYEPDEARQMKALRALMKACPIAGAQGADAREDIGASGSYAHDANAREDAGDTARLPCGPAATRGPGQPIPSRGRTMR